MTTTKNTTAEALQDAAAALVASIARQLDGATTYVDGRGDTHATAKAGSRVVEIHPDTDGARVTTWIDYGTHGRSFCEGRSYRSAAGALKFARAFLAR